MPVRELVLADDVKIGDTVVYADAEGVEHHALVNAVWPGEYGSDQPPGVNLVYISSDPKKTDNYGVQIERRTSVVYKSSQPAHGNYWRM